MSLDLTYRGKLGETIDSVSVGAPPKDSEVTIDTNAVPDSAKAPDVTFDSDPDGPKLSAAPTTTTGSRVKYFGEYELLNEIARGGMGVVYKAQQVKLNRIVALKMILSGNLAGSEEVKRFQTEAEAAANLDHPGIVPIYEIGEHNGQHYFSMGFVEGQSLQQKLAVGPLPAKEAARLTRKIAEAVAYAHEKGVIHRDLKPANVLLDTNGEPKVTDFGLAKKVDADSGLTRTGSIMGTPSYLPPEQATGQTDKIGPAADVDSLGAILYALRTGRPPFQAASMMETLQQVVNQEPARLRALNPAVDNGLETIFHKCLTKSANDRYQSALELADDIGRFERGEPIIARRVSIIRRFWMLYLRHVVVAAGGIALATKLLTLTTMIGITLDDGVHSYCRENEIDYSLIVYGWGAVQISGIVFASLVLRGHIGFLFGTAVVTMIDFVIASLQVLGFRARRHYLLNLMTIEEMQYVIRLPSYAILSLIAFVVQIDAMYRVWTNRLH